MALFIAPSLDLNVLKLTVIVIILKVKNIMILK